MMLLIGDIILDNLNEQFGHSPYPAHTFGRGKSVNTKLQQEKLDQDKKDCEEFWNSPLFQATNLDKDYIVAQYLKYRKRGLKTWQTMKRI